MTKNILKDHKIKDKHYRLRPIYHINNNFFNQHNNQLIKLNQPHQ